VGGFPPGWAEWNDRYRDTVRHYWKGDAGQASQLATRLAASADFFNVRGRKPWASINFITAHDGFTLNDLVLTTTSTMKLIRKTIRTGLRITTRGTVESKVRPTTRQ
jgi:pullulanase/glycogen debranching enzyme